MGLNLKPLTIHQVTGKMADAVLKSSAIERSFDNLTVVIIAFKNLNRFYEGQKQKQISKTQTIKIEGEVSQIDSNATSKNKRPQKLVGGQSGDQAHAKNQRLSASSSRSSRLKQQAHYQENKRTSQST